MIRGDTFCLDLEGLQEFSSSGALVMTKTVTQSQLDRILAANMSVQHSPPVCSAPKHPQGAGAAVGNVSPVPVLPKPKQLPPDASLLTPSTIGTTYAEVTKASLISKIIFFGQMELKNIV